MSSVSSTTDWGLASPEVLAEVLGHHPSAVHFLDIVQGRQCAWPLWRGDEHRLVCGAPVERGSYCPACTRLSRPGKISTKTRQEQREAARLLRLATARSFVGGGHGS